MQSLKIFAALTIGLLSAACAQKESDASSVAVTSAEIVPPRGAPVLSGTWLRIAPLYAGDDTLRLQADSGASGLIPWPPDKLARITHWKLKFMSMDPPAEREDWRYGHKDGGDPECMRDNPACVSLPVLCLGAADQYICEAFHVAGDSLLLSSGLRFVRAPAIPDSLAHSDSGAPQSAPSTDGDSSAAT